MNDIINELIVVFPDGRIIGCEDNDSVESILHDYNEENIREYCDENDLDYEDLSYKRRAEILYEVGYEEGTIRVYESKKVISAIKKSEMDDDDKKDLIEKLTEYEIEFDIDEYSEFQEILDGVSEVNI